MGRFYEWDKTFSRLTGTQGEITLVLGAKDIGKTFGLRLRCIERFIKKREPFCEICRTKEEKKAVAPCYFDKIQSEGFFSDYVFKTDSNAGYIALKPVGEEKPDWKLICYFVALTNFQQEKKRTFSKPRYFIFDEAIIDIKDKFHRYLQNEYLILANLLDSISRQQPNDTYKYNVFLLGNAVDMTCPYLRHLGIKKLPKFGYAFYKNKTVLLHYVEPWDADERREQTLVGRMLEGNDESKVIFDNIFEDNTGNEIAKKTSNAKFKFAFIFNKMRFGIWHDKRLGYWYVCSKIPKDASAVYTLTKSDSSINYEVVRSADPFAKMLCELYYMRMLRYESAHIREAFFEILGFLGIK